MKLSRTIWISILISSGTLVILASTWWALTPGVIAEKYFPSPTGVWAAAASLKWNLLNHSLMTFARVLIGLEVGIFAGMFAGLLLSWDERLRAALNPLIEFLRPVPVVAMVPFFIIWFGTGVQGQLVLIALSSFMVLMVNTMVAVNNVPSIYIRAARTLGVSKLKIFRTVIFPAIVPQLQSGFRIAAALAFAVGIAAEFIGAQAGLGFMIMVARRTLNTNTILLGIMIIVLEAFVVDIAIRIVGAYYSRWKESSEESIRQLRPLRLDKVNI